MIDDDMCEAMRGPSLWVLAWNQQPPKEQTIEAWRESIYIGQPKEVLIIPLLDITDKKFEGDSWLHPIRKRQA